MRPLVLLTRPRSASEKLAARLAADGIDALIWPVIEPARVAHAPLSTAGAQAVILTSANAAYAVPPGLSVWCVGPATARAARAAGAVEVTETGGDAAALAARLRRDLRPEDGAILYPCGADRARDMAAMAPEHDIRETVVYEARAASAAPGEIAKAITSRKLTAAAFFSPRSAAIFAALAEPDWRAGLSDTTVVAISEKAAREVNGMGFSRVLVSDAPDGEAMRAAISGACAPGL